MSRLTQILLRLACLAVALGLMGAGAARWHHTRQPDYRLQRAQEALRRGELDEILSAASALEDDGYSDHAHALRGEYFLRQQRIPEAIQELNAIREEAENVRVDVGVTFGLGFLSLDRPREAEHLFKYVLARRPDTLDAHRGLASIYFDQGAKALTVLHVREWLRLAPEDGYAWRFLGVVYSDFGDSNDWAIDAFRAALRCGLREPIDLTVRTELAQLLVKQTRFNEALEVVAELSAQDAATPDFLEVQGECLRGLRRPAELQAIMEQATQHSRHVGLLRLRGQVLLDAEDSKAAAACLEQALALDRHDLGSLHLLAQAYEGLGRKADAAEQRRLLLQYQADLEQISELSTEAIDKPWNAGLRIRLADLCEKLDLHKEAGMWRKAVRFCPPEPQTAGRAPRRRGLGQERTGVS